MQLAHTKLIFACFMGFLVNGYYCNLILLRTNKPYIYTHLLTVLLTYFTAIELF